MMVSAPLIIGHRGASATAPENTLAAFSRALADGADGIEFDVRLSRDHIPVVIHDDSLRRTGLVDRLVANLTAAELQQSDVSQWFNERQVERCGYDDRIPTLSRVLSLISSSEAIAYLEMKSDARGARLLADAVAKEIKFAGLADRIVVSSFDLAVVEMIKQIDPVVRTAALFEPKISNPVLSVRPRHMIERAQQISVDEIALHYSLASPRIVAAAQQRGLDVVVWTVDDRSWVERAASMGVKALITNIPGAFVQHRQAIFENV